MQVNLNFINHLNKIAILNAPVVPLYKLDIIPLLAQSQLLSLIPVLIAYNVINHLNLVSLHLVMSSNPNLNPNLNLNRNLNHSPYPVYIPLAMFPNLDQNLHPLPNPL